MDSYNFLRQKLAMGHRAKRDFLLKECDWTQMPDCNSANKEAWANYRQALRDVPSQSGFPENIQWPTKPE